MIRPIDTGNFTLSMTAGGRWLVRTQHSEYHLDLDRLTVTRIPGNDAVDLPAIKSLRLLAIDQCHVGEPGRWQIEANDESEWDYYWALTTLVTSITPDTSEVDAVDEKSPPATSG